MEVQIVEKTKVKKRKETLFPLISKYNFLVKAFIERLIGLDGIKLNESYIWELPNELNFEPILELEKANLDPSVIKEDLIAIVEYYEEFVFVEYKTDIYVSIKHLMKLLPKISKNKYCEFGPQSLETPVEFYILIAFDFINGGLKTNTLLSYVHNITNKKSLKADYPWKCFVRKVSYEFYKLKNPDLKEYLQFIMNLSFQSILQLSENHDFIQKYKHIVDKDYCVPTLKYEEKVSLENRLIKKK